MSILNTKIYMTEFEINEDLRILKVSIENRFNYAMKLFKVDQTLTGFEKVHRDQELIVDKVLPFIKKLLVQHSPTYFHFENVNNLYIHAYLKIDQDKVNEFNRLAKKGHKIEQVKNFTAINDFLKEINIVQPYIFEVKEQEQGVFSSKKVKELLKSDYEEKTWISLKTSFRRVFLNQTNLEAEQLKVLYSREEGCTPKIFVAPQNDKKNYVSHLIQQSKFGSKTQSEKILFLINEDMLNTFDDSVKASIGDLLGSKGSDAVIMLSSKDWNNYQKPISKFNQLTSNEDQICFLKNGKNRYMAEKDKRQKEILHNIEIIANNKKFEKLQGQKRKLKMQIEVKDQVFYAKASYELKGCLSRTACFSSKSIKKLTKKIIETLTTESIFKNKTALFLYCPESVEKTMKQCYESHLDLTVFSRLMNADQEISFNLADDQDLFVFLDVKKEQKDTDQAEEAEELPKVKRKQEASEIKKLLDSYQNKKSKHVFTCVYVKENEKKDCFLFHIITTKFSKNANRVFEYKGVNVIPKVRLFDSPNMFLNKIKGCMKHINRSRAQEVNFIFSFSEKFKKDFETLFEPLNEIQYKRGAPLFSLKDIASLNNQVACCLHNGMKMANEYDDDKTTLQAEDEFKSDLFYVYSDASVKKSETSKRFGYGIVLTKGDTVFKEYMGANSSPYTVSADTSEFNAIYFALKKIRDLKIEGLIPVNAKIEVRSDCLNAIRFYDNGLNKDKLNGRESLNNIYHLDLVKAQCLLSRPEMVNMVSFKWTKGHMNEIYNDRADAMAKRAYFSAVENTLIEITDENDESISLNENAEVA